MAQPKTHTDETIDFGFEDIPASEKAGRVRGVFDSVAGKYDIMNDAMSMGVYRIWKDMTITKINPQPGEVHVDVAGGTGDLARRFIKAAERVRARRGGVRTLRGGTAQGARGTAGASGETTRAVRDQGRGAGLARVAK